MRFQVPQFIEIEDKIFGPLTFKQFIYIAGSIGIGVIAFAFLPTFIAIIIALPVAAFGAMLAFEPKGGLSAARRFCDRVRVFLLASSLGGVESLVILTVYTSHYNMSAAELRTAGVTPGTVRVSVGLEDASDLIADLRQALA